MGYQPKLDIQGWMNGQELAWLHDRAAESRSVLEVGSWRGRSTHALLSGCPGAVFAVDHFKGSPNELKGAHRDALTKDIFEEFWQNVGEFKNLVAMRMESTVAASFFRRRSVDMVFIDGCHAPEAVRADVLAWLPVCRSLFCGHDYASVRETLENMSLKIKKEVGSLWSMRLR